MGCTHLQSKKTTGNCRCFDTTQRRGSYRWSYVSIGLEVVLDQSSNSARAGFFARKAGAHFARQRGGLLGLCGAVVGLLALVFRSNHRNPSRHRFEEGCVTFHENARIAKKRNEPGYSWYLCAWGIMIRWAWLGC